MDRKRVEGKFVPETADERAARRLEEASQGEVETEKGGKRSRRPSLKASRLRYCRKLVSHKVAEAMPSIVDALVEEATKGSVEHTKEFLKVAFAEQGKVAVEPPKRRGKGLAQRLLEELRSRRLPESQPPKPGLTDGVAGRASE
jgi:hypothetical protein